MSDLEEMGYLTHPHTSAGRVPSDKAYRLYVNSLMEKHELSPTEKNLIAERLRANVNEFDETIRHAAKLLSEITNLTSFAMTPTKNEDTLKFINLLPVDENTVVLMIVSESGKISNTALRMRGSLYGRRSAASGEEHDLQLQRQEDHRRPSEPYYCQL